MIETPPPPKQIFSTHPVFIPMLKTLPLPALFPGKSRNPEASPCRNSILALLLACLSATSGISAEAPATLFEEDFEGYDLPSAPIQDAALNSSSTSGWKLLGFGDEAVVTQVVEKSSTEGSGNNVRALQLKSPISPRLSVWNLFEPVQTGGPFSKLEIRFKFLISSDLQEPSDMVFGVIEDASRPASSLSYLTAIRIRFDSAGASRFSYYEGEGEARESVNLPMQITPDTWYEVSMVLDFASHTWGLSINNLDSTESAVSKDGIAMRQDATSVAGFGIINRTPPAALNHFFDDILVRAE